MIITRVKPSWYMGICMMGWAVVSGLTAVVHNYTGIVLVRFFLGVVEAPYYPGALYLLSIFYTRKEIATRISILYSGNILASSFAGLIALGVFKLDNVHGIRYGPFVRSEHKIYTDPRRYSGWRWLFIIQGAATFVIAVAACFILPDEPLTTWWLNPEERTLAHARVARDTVGHSADVSMLAGLKEAVRDPKVWVFVYMQHLHM
jgi:MFS family permease